MAKCPICNSRKGKRPCLIMDAPICSQCCGTTRTADTCSGCGFYQPPKRNYNEVPAYTPAEMDGNPQLESIGNSIEGALVAYDVDIGQSLTDKDAITIVERLIDRYHFQVQDMSQDSQLIQDGVERVDLAMNDDLGGVNQETLVKVLGVIRFVARRRTRLGREYMQVIHQFVGHRVAPGIRALSL